MGDYSRDIPYAVVIERTFMNRVYAWMTFGLVLTGLVAIATAMTPALQKVVLGNQVVFFGLIIGQFVLVVAMSAGAARMSSFAMSICFIIYAAALGLTLSVIFLAFDIDTIYLTFFVTAGTFGATSLYGYKTKRDLTAIGSLLRMALFGIIIAIIVNMFLRNTMLDFMISIIGVLVFVGLTAYDTQKLKAIHRQGRDGTDADKKLALLGALRLYLDFVNLFLFLLRLFARRR